MGEGLPQNTAQQNLVGDRRKFLLIVDDEEIIRNLMAELLNDSGYQILTAANGREAIDVYQNSNEKIELVITDVKMPVMDGITAIEKLKEINPNLKFMVVTGLLDDAQMFRLKNLGVEKIVEKPFIAEEYLKFIDELLN